MLCTAELQSTGHTHTQMQIQRQIQPGTVEVWYTVVHSGTLGALSREWFTQWYTWYSWYTWYTQWWFGTHSGTQSGTLGTERRVRVTDQRSHSSSGTLGLERTSHHLPFSSQMTILKLNFLSMVLSRISLTEKQFNRQCLQKRLEVSSTQCRDPRN